MAQILSKSFWQQKLALWQHKAGQADKLLIHLIANTNYYNIANKAVAQLSQLDSFAPIIEQSNNPAIRKLVAECWARRISFDSDITDFEREQLVLDCNTDELLAALVLIDNNHHLTELALTGIKTDNVKLALLSYKPREDVFLKIIEQISSKEALEKALPLCQHNGVLFRRTEAAISQL